MNHLKVLRYSIVFILGAFGSIAYAIDQTPPYPVAACIQQVPLGIPKTLDKNPTYICRKAYILEHDPIAKIPRWVAWTLIPEHAIGCLPRKDSFAADASLPIDQRSTPSDYAGSGYDQGHLANNADMSWNEDVMRESFIMSNMSPQLPSVNRGVWKELEEATRALVHQTKHAYTIYAGNIYTLGGKTIGSDKVIVPQYLYKILIDNTTKTSYAFMMPHKDGLISNILHYQTTVNSIEILSGYKFPVPDTKTNKNQFPIILSKTYADDKKKQCKE